MRVVVSPELGADLNPARRKEAIRECEFLAAVFLTLLFWPSNGISFCHEQDLVHRSLLRVAAPQARSVAIKWFGHATFQITSSKGTRILTDPHTRDDLPWPPLPQHIVTTSHNHGPHSNIWMAKGQPVILEGLCSHDDWKAIHTVIRDVSVYTVPAYHDKSQGYQRGKNAIFVFRVDNVCIAHLGDLGHKLTEGQLKILGEIDVLLVPIAGGWFTVTAEEAREVTRQVNPRIAIPMHYWWEGALEGYIRDQPRVTRLASPILTTSKEKLPVPTEIVVLGWN